MNLANSEEFRPHKNGKAFKGTVAWDGSMSCYITSQKMIKDLNFFCLGQLLAELWMNLYILVHMPYALRNWQFSYRISCGDVQTDPNVSWPDFSWPDVLRTGRFVSGRFSAKQSVTRRFVGLPWRSCCICHMSLDDLSAYAIWAKII